MNISEKLALMFIEKHFHHFDADVESGTILKSTDIPKCNTLTNGVKAFMYCGHTLFVYLPTILSPESASKKRMINIVQRNEISFEDVDVYEWDWYRVTQNRLDVLEEIMYNSGMTDAGSIYRFSDKDIVKYDATEKAEMSTFAQDYLTLLNGLKQTQDNKAWFYADDVETLCRNVDAIYSKKLRQKDEQLCKIDPKAIECSSKVIELATNTLSSMLKSIDGLFDKLTVMIRQK